MSDKNTEIVKRVIRQVLFYVCLIVLWQTIFHYGTSVFSWWKPYAFPNPFGVWSSLLKMIEQNLLLTVVFISLRRALTGFLISIFIGAVIGLLLARYRTVSELSKPLILGIQSLPSVCWVPFAILWFGLTESSILFVIIMGSSFCISIAVEAAICSVNPLYIKAAKTMGEKGAALYIRVILPASLPTLITGLKQGWSFAWRSLMAAEVMSATIGLGQMLMMGRDLADINRVMLIILIVILLGALIEKFVFGIAEKRLRKRIGL